MDWPILSSLGDEDHAPNLTLLLGPDNAPPPTTPTTPHGSV